MGDLYLLNNLCLGKTETYNYSCISYRHMWFYEYTGHAGHVISMVFFNVALSRMLDMETV